MKRTRSGLGEPQVSPHRQRNRQRETRTHCSPRGASPLLVNFRQLRGTAANFSNIPASPRQQQACAQACAGFEETNPPGPWACSPVEPAQSKLESRVVICCDGPDKPGGNITFNRQDLAATSPGEPARRASQRACLPRPSPVS